MPEYQPGDEIPTKHKEAIRQLHRQAKIGATQLAKTYKSARSSVYRIWEYDAPERARPSRIGVPRTLNNNNIQAIIVYISELYNHWKLDLQSLHDELELEYSVKILERRLKEAGYYRYTACQKLFLTIAQAAKHWTWAFVHLFWTWQ